MSPQKPKILYFVAEKVASTNGVLHSTVLAEAGYLHKNGFDCFFVGTDISEEKAAEAEKYIKEQYGIPSKIFGFNSMKFRFVSARLLARKVARLSKDIISDYHPTHVWTDMPTSSVIGRKIAREQGAISVFDVQAAWSEEVKLRNGKGIRYWVGRWIEMNELKKSDRLGGVSHKLKQWVQDLTGRDDLVVVQCCVDTEKFYFDEEVRKQIRQKYGFKDKEKVICYSGGLNKWQRIQDIIRLFSQVSKMDENFKFLFITRKTKQIRQIVQKNNLPLSHCVIESCTQQEVPKYLSAADVGIILRDDLLLNNVASPIKIGEYLACSLPVLLTKGIGDYSEMIAEAGAGCILDESSDLARQVVDFVEKSNFKELRHKARALALKSISWDSHLDNLKQLFRIETAT